MTSLVIAFHLFIGFLHFATKDQVKLSHVCAQEFPDPTRSLEGFAEAHGSNATFVGFLAAARAVQDVSVVQIRSLRIDPTYNDMA